MIMRYALAFINKWLASSWAHKTTHSLPAWPRWSRWEKEREREREVWEKPQTTSLQCPLFLFCFFANLPAAAEAVKSAQNFAVLLRRSVDAEISNLVTQALLCYFICFSPFLLLPIILSEQEREGERRGQLYIAIINRLISLPVSSADEAEIATTNDDKEEGFRMAPE